KPRKSWRFIYISPSLDDARARHIGEWSRETKSRAKNFFQKNARWRGVRSCILFTYGYYFFQRVCCYRSASESNDQLHTGYLSLVGGSFFYERIRGADRAGRPARPCNGMRD